MYDGHLNQSRGISLFWIRVKAEGEYAAIEWMVAFILMQGPNYVE